MKEKRFTRVTIKPLTHSKHYLFPIYQKIDCYQVRLSVKVNCGIVQQIQGKNTEKPFKSLFKTENNDKLNKQKDNCKRRDWFDFVTL